MQLQVEEVERLKRILLQDQESTKQSRNQQGALERRVDEARAVISTGATVEERIEQLHHARLSNQALEDLAESQQSLLRKKLEIQQAHYQFHIKIFQVIVNELGRTPFYLPLAFLKLLGRIFFFRTYGDT